ncbi:MAG TPA: hypothetical protein VIH90_05375 [Candidatus Saccharimonadales bacterium]
MSKILGPVVLVIGIAFVYSSLTSPRYKVSSEAQKLIGTPDVALAKQSLTYSKKTGTYSLNKKLEGQPAVASNSVRIGGGDSTSYSFDAPANLNNKKMTFYDNLNNLSFSIQPNFKTATAKYANGQFVYPINHNEQAVYTVKSNGLREDIILNKSVGDSTSFSYKLDLPSSLQARLMPSGAIGVFSANPVLFGNISYGSNADRSKVSAAREKAQKTYLEFVLMPPTISSSNGSNGPAKSQFALSGTTVTVKATGLKGLSYPVSIDPSVVVSSASTFGGNNESNVNNTGTSISTNYITGGYVNSWASATGAITTPRTGNAIATYNGLVYSVGGVTSSSSGSCTTGSPSTYYCGDVQYALIGGGTIGSWSTTTSFTTPRAYSQAIAYNGYLYVFGGVTSSSATGCTTGSGSTYYCGDVQYAPICNGSVFTGGCTPSSIVGSLGTWVTDANPFSTPRYDFSAVAYAGYIYIMGGISAASTDQGDIQYTSFNADGSVGSGSWTSVTGGVKYNISGTMTSVTMHGESATAYNGHLYIMDGYHYSGTPGDYNYVGYAQINSDGSLGMFMNTTASGVSQDNFSMAVYSGYIYEWGGVTNFGFAGNNQLEYAQINSNGSLGTWYSSTTNSLTSVFPVGEGGSVALGGYLYNIGGQHNSATDPTCGPNTTNYCNKTFSTQISSAGNLATNTWASTLPAYPSSGVLYDPTVLVNAGYIYVMGGCTNAASASKACHSSATADMSQNIYYDTIAPDGTIGSNTWTTNSITLTSNEYGGTAVVVGTELYILQQCSAPGTGNVCGATSPPQEYQINSRTGAISNSSGVTGPAGYSAVLGGDFTYDGNVYMIGGCSVGTGGSSIPSGYFCGSSGGSLATNLSYYAPGGGVITSGNWLSTSSLPTAMFGFSTAVYNNYVYVFGGCTASGTNSSGGCTVLNSNIYVGKLSPSGGILSWATVSTSGIGGRYQPASVAYNGYLYIMGGCTALSNSSTNFGCSSGNLKNDIWSVPLSPSTGAPGTPTNLSSVNPAIQLHNSMWGFGAYVNNGVIGTYGGCTGASVNAVDPMCGSMIGAGYTNVLNAGGNGILTSSSGTLSWNTAASLCTNLGQTSSVAYEGYLFVAGGIKASASTTCSDGLSSQYSNAVNVYALNPDGTTTAVSGSPFYFTTPRASAGIAAYNGYLYITGGTTDELDTNSVNEHAVYDIQYAAISPSTGALSCAGTCTGSTPSTACPVNACASGSVFAYLASTGGSTSDPYNFGVQTYCPFGCFTSSITGFTDPYTFIYNNKLFTLISGSCYVFKVSSYTVVPIGNPACPNNYAVNLNSNGTLGSEATITQPPLNVQTTNAETNAATVYGNNIYEYYGSSSNLLYTGTISGTTINWSSGVNPDGLYQMGGVSGSLYAYNGYLYFQGGEQGSSTNGDNCDTTATSSIYCNSIWAAPINSNGSTGTFSLVGDINSSAAYGYISTATYNGYAYYIGGDDGTTYYSNIYSIGLGSQPHTALYSYLANMERNVTPIEATLAGSNAAPINSPGTGGIGLGYKFATTSCATFNNLNQAPIIIGSKTLTTLSTDNCSNTTNLAQYEWVSLLIDDSSAFAFPDNSSSGNSHTNVSAMNLYYHPATGNRLRLGQTFTNDRITSLDAPP